RGAEEAREKTSWRRAHGSRVRQPVLPWYSSRVFRTGRFRVCGGGAFSARPRALDPVPRQRFAYETRGSQVIDERAQVACGRLTACFGHAHGLPDDHERLLDQAQTRVTGSIGLELLFDSGGYFESLCDECIDDSGRSWDADEGRTFQLACQEEVVSTTGAGRDARIRSVHLAVVPDRTILPHQVAAFDQDVGLG